MTASAHIEGKRWSLLQGLAWVIARDELLTASAAPDDPDGYPRGPMWLTIQTAPSGTMIGVSEAWQSLADVIACGRVAADGRPDRADGQLTDRVPLIIEARDLKLDGERHGLRRELHCFLLGTSSGQRSWFDVELSVADVMQSFPSPIGLSNSKECKLPSAPAGRIAAVQAAFVELWPNGVPTGYPAKNRNRDIAGLLLSQGIPVSDATIRRALSALDQR